MLFGLTTIFGCAPPEPPAPRVAPPCAQCHAAEAAAWEGSHHALAERPVGPDDAWATELGGVRIVGVDPLQQALVPAAEGRLQAHSTAWDPTERTTFELHTDGRQPGDWGHWTGRGMNWNSRCAACHDTGVTKGPVGDGYATEVDATGVTCAACHGDAAAHALGGTPPTNAAMEDTCFACHLRRAELGVRIEPGLALLEVAIPTFLDDPVFRADGLGLDEVFEGTNFASSAMHEAGVRCGDCHDPHSGALRAEGDALCERCHASIPLPAAHPVHPDVDCVECHMPRLTVMQRHARRDHGFTSPRRGLQPDACAACHPEHPATAEPDPQDIAFERVRNGGELGDLDLQPTNRWRRAAVLRLLRDRPEGEAPLLEALGSPDPLIQSAAAGAWYMRSNLGIRPLEPLLQDPVRAVRVAAQRSWVEGGGAWERASDYRRYLDHNADDPATRAERGLARVNSGDGGGIDDLLWAIVHDPNSAPLRIAASIGLSRVGRHPEAVRLLLDTEAAHPDDAEVQWSLAVGLAGLQRDAEAIARFEGLVQRDPDHARAWRNLALLYKRTNDPKFMGALERALALDPSDRELAAWRRSLQP